ncbi:aldo/keto reductase [Pseudomonas syringae]|uniref:aldo/keto reductase n=1 Tax=Pseudomonas syringae TaxID=317 RepID=UPI00215ABEFF|nr:aldo/keto reductase [Pseudomonas syringae]MCR8717701.1 aldo/keto reductase [Pseudomonas syringae]
MSLKDKIIGQLGFGSAPLGNAFRSIPEDEAAATVQAAWDAGIRYFDTAPLYGAGLAEERLGLALSNYSRDQFTLSSKVGRLISDEARDSSYKGDFEFGKPNKIITDYSADATLRSIESSLQRLKMDRLDVVYVHDPAQDAHGDQWIEHYNVARTGAFKVLARLKEEGVIKAWGLGVNRVEPCELTLDLEESEPDGFLLAGRYSILDHNQPFERLFTKAAKHNAEFVIGGAYSSGVLVGGKHFNYREAPPQVLARVQDVQTLARSFDVDIKSAALQFVIAHPLVAAVIPGSSKPSRIGEDISAFKAVVPDEFWAAMKAHGYIAEQCPTP